MARNRRAEIATTRSALEAANAGEGGDQRAVDRLVRLILDLGIDGRGPLPSARRFAEAVRRREGGDAEKGVGRIVRTSVLRGAAGGFVTGLGGFVTMPVALPANILEFYVQATRMVAGIATLRGYDVDRPEVRTAVLLTLVRSDADEVLRKAGMATGTGRVAAFALRRLPPAALMVVNKAIGFRLLRGLAERLLSRIGRGVPLLGGAIGAAIDGWMMTRIASHALRELPPVRPS
jgi:hypothetical protein